MRTGLTENQMMALVRDCMNSLPDPDHPDRRMLKRDRFPNDALYAAYTQKWQAAKSELTAAPRHVPAPAPRIEAPKDHGTNGHHINAAYQMVAHMADAVPAGVASDNGASPFHVGTVGKFRTSIAVPPGYKLMIWFTPDMWCPVWYCLTNSASPINFSLIRATAYAVNTNPMQGQDAAGTVNSADWIGVTYDADPFLGGNRRTQTKGGAAQVKLIASRDALANVFAYGCDEYDRHVGRHMPVTLKPDATNVVSSDQLRYHNTSLDGFQPVTGTASSLDRFITADPMAGSCGTASTRHIHVPMPSYQRGWPQRGSSLQGNPCFDVFATSPLFLAGLATGGIYVDNSASTGAISMSLEGAVQHCVEVTPGDAFWALARNCANTQAATYERGYFGGHLGYSSDSFAQATLNAAQRSIAAVQGRIPPDDLQKIKTATNVALSTHTERVSTTVGGITRVADNVNHDAPHHPATFFSRAFSWVKDHAGDIVQAAPALIGGARTAYNVAQTGVRQLAGSALGAIAGRVVPAIGASAPLLALL